MTPHSQTAPSLKHKKAAHWTKAVLCTLKRARDLSVPAALRVMQGAYFFRYKEIIYVTSLGILLPEAS